MEERDTEREKEREREIKREREREKKKKKKRRRRRKMIAVDELFRTGGRKGITTSSFMDRRQVRFDNRLLLVPLYRVVPSFFFSWNSPRPVSFHTVARLLTEFYRVFFFPFDSPR